MNHNCHCQDELRSSWSGLSISPSRCVGGFVVGKFSLGDLPVAALYTLFYGQNPLTLDLPLLAVSKNNPCNICFLLTTDYVLSLVDTPLHDALRLLLYSTLATSDSGLACLFLFPFFTSSFLSSCFTLLYIYAIFHLHSWCQKSPPLTLLLWFNISTRLAMFTVLFFVYYHFDMTYV